MKCKFSYLASPMPLIILLSMITSCICYSDASWLPPKQYQKRPTSDSFCQAGVIPFCPTGLPSNTMPKFKQSDTLYVYAMKAPVWEFKFGSLLADFHIMHDAIGFHHVQSGLNLTMEWYELFQLFNCTFPHEPNQKGKPELLWCNQGATCAYPGIDEKHWKQNGTLVKVSQISGDLFNKFADWVEQDNTTYPFYETWTSMDKPGGNIWFKPMDCASWVLRAFAEMKKLGGNFDHNVHLNYTKLVLYNKEPEKLGNFTEIFTNPSMNKTKTDLINFYGKFQRESNYETLVEHLLEALLEFLVDDSFFLYYNDIYWKLPLSSPYIQITYDEVPLP